MQALLGRRSEKFAILPYHRNAAAVSERAPRLGSSSSAKTPTKTVLEFPGFFPALNMYLTDTRDKTFHALLCRSGAVCCSLLREWKILECKRVLCTFLKRQCQENSKSSMFRRTRATIHLRGDKSIEQSTRRVYDVEAQTLSQKQGCCRLSPLPQIAVNKVHRSC